MFYNLTNRQSYKARIRPLKLSKGDILSRLLRCFLSHVQGTGLYLQHISIEVLLYETSLFGHRNAESGRPLAAFCREFKLSRGGARGTIVMARIKNLC
jgi:hypothetical protein